MNALFHGHVQGVGFRFTTVEVARDFEMTGYVMNTMDGSVRVVAEALEEDLLKFLEQIRAAHIYRYVVKEDLNWSNATGEFSGFTIKYS